MRQSLGKGENAVSSSSFPLWGFPGDSVVKNLPANAGDVVSVPGAGRSPEEGNGNLLQDSRLGNPTGTQGVRHELEVEHAHMHV